MSEINEPLKILALDGGGSKGVYTIGVLKELELKLGKPLYQHFNLIFGTSTGSIIASLIGLGYDMPSIEKMYFDIIPKIMKESSSSQKSAVLKKEADRIFEENKFDAFKTYIGIVSLNYDTQRPLVFKSNRAQAHGMIHSFEPGFGKTISEAVQCSCAAYPIFDKINIDLINKDSITNVNVIDGGFIANDPTLFAMIDAHKAFGKETKDIRVLSVGVGEYVEKPLGFWFNLIRKAKMIRFVEKVLSANTNTNVIIAKLLFPDLRMVRICDAFPEPEYGTNMIEMDLEKLRKINSLGRTSFAKKEKEIEALFQY
jgi:uncharacterized protein